MEAENERNRKERNCENLQNKEEDKEENKEEDKSKANRKTKTKKVQDTLSCILQGQRAKKVKDKEEDE